MYRKSGKLNEKKVGRQFQDDMTSAKDSSIRGLRITGNQLSNSENRLFEKENFSRRKTVGLSIGYGSNTKTTNPNLKG
jgi:hypothetical protein